MSLVFPDRHCVEVVVNMSARFAGCVPCGQILLAAIIHKRARGTCSKRPNTREYLSRELAKRSKRCFIRYHHDEREPLAPCSQQHLSKSHTSRGLFPTASSCYHGSERGFRSLIKASSSTQSWLSPHQRHSLRGMARD